MTDRAVLPPPPAGEGTPRSGGGEGSALTGQRAPGASSASVAPPLSRSLPTQGSPSPAEGEGRGCSGERRFEPVSLRLRDFAKEQRRLRTNAEDLFWQQVRAGRFRGLKFRRQAPVPPYIADFLCASVRLIVELDGEPHETEERRQRDAKRDEWLKAQGFDVLRFPNDLVLMNLGAVLDRVGEAVRARLGRDLSGTVAPLSRPRLTPGPPSPAEGGGSTRVQSGSGEHAAGETKHTAPPPPSAGEGTLRSRGGEGSAAAGAVAPGVTSSTVALHLSRPPLTPGSHSPAEGGGGREAP
ncbi:endonuclease domain-containing protein [Methylobacterium sp. J-076]|uniref:endonuclease domain-containing protein n=1 Tax=Methylobacterium sp. J-076 TaxID=2836655 RepID=UPI001FB8DC4C|nr:DUF559 domain-containing protein [Methylobacterium sp. J-076]MCJ2011413.1 DUF559 domain-containing protein [Methylobacterium sp. J-076]